MSNVGRQGIATGFDFLNSTAGFAIIQTLIPYSESSSYGRAFIVGLLNSALVATLAIIFSTIIGFTVGIARISNNWLVAKLAACYVELIRNIPLLLQIFFWYFVVLRSLPVPRQSYVYFDSIFLNNRGIYLPTVTFASWFSGSPFTLNVPQLQGFNFTGGFVILPELAALLTGLTCYTAAFIAEIVRSGILGVTQGQREAAYSLGMSRSQTTRLVILPQAVRIIIPPLTSQFLNVVKNSSLAAAIGYPDLVAVFAGTVLNQTGQAIEVIFITMMVYLAISLGISLFMNMYHARAKWAEP
jgi:general L-amino acid transport system permease protein